MSGASSSTAPEEGTTTTIITATTHLTLPAHPIPLTYEQLNPRSKPTEFFGPLGTAAISVLAPLFTYIFFFACNDAVGCTPTTVRGWQQAWEYVSNFPSTAGHLWEWKAAGVYTAWYAYTVLCWAVLPGDKIQGNLLRDGTRKTYKMNGLYTLLLTLGLSLGVILQPGGIQLYTWLYDHWVPLASAALVMSTFQALFVYAQSYYNKELLSLGGNSGNFFYDFFMGRPLNPHPPFFPSFDLKTFNEVRPGMILWLLLNISCACEQYLRIGKLSDSMWVVLIFEGWYTADCLIQEHTILNQMDITTDGFGFMLSMGDLLWVPFTYGLQARYLAFNPVHLGKFWLTVVVSIILIGNYIFRTANNEKAHFRAGKNPKNLEYMQTERGTKLLTSGWWGRSRHPNYFGDWLMALGWCLPTGFSTPLTYYYIVFFVILLVHRQRRDDEACRHKYGKDWDKYCELVPWRIIPYVSQFAYIQRSAREVCAAPR
ncbi:delta14-sterol reductase [Kwoniella heveanensis BCC8398]|uniref:Delta(14)-sterol reductase ERG24 n=1 Tax=Kwoniella heveanensis BCC8398 TaxID=1296120 RepID=A0A1B9H0B2_9TREE|nr:delta14-sterol reductase [Kwoniella heveanensis BCC8398]